MLLSNQNIQSNAIGLNGFFRSFWNSFKRAIGLRYDDEQQLSGFGGRLGGFLGRVIDSFLNTATVGGWDGITGDTNKILGYEPTPQEIAILNPIVAALNNFALELTANCDGILKSNTTIENQVAAFNNAVRQLQILRDYYGSHPLSNLSTQAQDKLAAEIDVLVKTFEATIEDILDNNGVAYQKVESYLAINSLDILPVVVPSNFQATGIQYRIENSNDTMPLLTDVPTRSNTPEPVKVAPVDTTSNEVVSGTGDTSNNAKTIGIVLLVAAVIAFIMPSDKNSKNDK